MMNKTFRNLGFGFIGLILVMSFIKIPSYPDVFVCDKTENICTLSSRKFWQEDYVVRKNFTYSDIDMMDAYLIKKENIPSVGAGKISLMRSAFHYKKQRYYVKSHLRLNMKNGEKYLFDSPELNQKSVEDMIETFNSFLTSTEDYVKIVFENRSK